MRICILGATGLVGRETIDLTSRAWPTAELVLFASRDQELKHGGKTYPVKAAASLELSDASRGDLAFVALDDEHSKRYVPRLVELGYRVIDKSNTFRADPKVPLVAAGVNHDIVTDEVRLVANPNCTTIPLVLALWPLHLRFGLSSATVSTYQAVSGSTRHARAIVSPTASACDSIRKRMPATPCPTTAVPTRQGFPQKSASSCSRAARSCGCLHLRFRRNVVACPLQSAITRTRGSHSKSPSLSRMCSPSSETKRTLPSFAFSPVRVVMD
jgi:aspartate-semialdehyde dehydrogenase